MKQYTTVAELRTALDHERGEGRRVGMVGTSGALHEGHLSLVRRSATENDVTAMFWGGALVFDWMDDEIAYQRDFERDLALAAGGNIPGLISDVLSAFSGHHEYLTVSNEQTAVLGLGPGWRENHDDPAWRVEIDAEPPIVCTMG